MSDRKVETPRIAARVDATLMGQERERREVVELLIDEVMPNRQQPRQNFDPASLTELADSIRLHSVLEPVLVRAIPLALYEGSGRQYELIAGERRWRAATLAGRQTIPALVLPEATSDQAVLEIAITENLQREDLHPLDEAAALGRMQVDLGYSYTEIADRLGKSKGYVQNRLRLLQLDADLRQLVAERPDTLTHVYELAKVTDPAQRQNLIEAVRSEDLSFSATRERVQAILNPIPAPSIPTVSSESRRPTSEKDQQDTLGGGKSYLYKYDQESAGLSSRDRSVLNVVSTCVEQLLDSPDKLSGADWAALEQLALRLSALLDARRELS
jgi:ParB family chromosome partitioning protein